MFLYLTNSDELPPLHCLSFMPIPLIGGDFFIFSFPGFRCASPGARFCRSFRAVGFQYSTTPRCMTNHGFPAPAVHNINSLRCTWGYDLSLFQSCLFQYSTTLRCMTVLDFPAPGGTEGDSGGIPCLLNPNPIQISLRRSVLIIIHYMAEYSEK